MNTDFRKRFNGFIINNTFADLIGYEYERKWDKLEDYNIRSEENNISCLIEAFGTFQPMAFYPRTVQTTGELCEEIQQKEKINKAFDDFIIGGG